MALMYCRECGKQVSSEAPACPHCGVPHPVYVAPPPQQPQPEHRQGYSPPQPEYARSYPPPPQQPEYPEGYPQQPVQAQYEQGYPPQPGYPQPYVQPPPQPQSLYAPQPVRQPDTTAAALLSLVIPGAGQMYKGDTGVGVAFLLGTIVGYASCFVPGLVLHIAAVIHAAQRN